MTRIALTVVAVWLAVAVPVAIILGKILAGAPCEPEQCELCGAAVCTRRAVP